MPPVMPNRQGLFSFLAGFSQQIVEMEEDLDGTDA